MTAVPHESDAGRSSTSWLLLTGVWASLAICVIWIAVALTALFGPDIVSDTPGGTSSHVPSAVAVAILAAIASWAIAKYGLSRRDRS